MSSEQLETYKPCTQDECEAVSEEQEFREWCKECELDPEDEGSREHYQEATGKTFWDDLDEDDAAGWQDNMNKD